MALLLAASLALGACSSSPSKTAQAARGSAGVWAPGAAADAPTDYAKAWEEVTQLIGAQNLTKAFGLLSEHIDSSRFKTLPAETQHAWLHTAGLLGINLRRYENAHEFLVAATELPGAVQEDWEGRFLTADATGNRFDSVQSLTVIARQYPALLQTFNARVLNRLALTPVSKEDADARLQMLDALFTAEWTLDYGLQPSEAWSDLAELWVERGNIERARAVSVRIIDPRTLLELKVDRRFEPLVRAAPERFDIDAAVARYIANLEALSQRFPRKLMVRAELIFACLDTGQYERVIQLTDEVLGERAGKPSLDSTYDDAAEQMNWILDYRAEALRGLQRWQQAERFLQDAASRPESGHGNVSNAIHLAMFHAQFGRAEPALAALGKLATDDSQITGYGSMQVQQVLYLVATARKDEGAKLKALEVMRQREVAAPSLLQDALLQANQMDEAAAFLIRRLKEPQLRAAALIDMQDYQKVVASPANLTLQKRWKQLRARSDVQAALAEVGRVERVPMPPAFR